MRVQKFSLSDANLVKSSGQDADIYVGNLSMRITAARSLSVTANTLLVRRSPKQWPSTRR